MSEQKLSLRRRWIHPGARIRPLKAIRSLKRKQHQRHLQEVYQLL